MSETARKGKSPLVPSPPGKEEAKLREGQPGLKLNTPPDSFSRSSSLLADFVPSVPEHELIRRIGEGSYGEVWLARSVMGSYRAVKVVYRKTFDHDRPYQREFTGMRRLKSLSSNTPSSEEEVRASSRRLLRLKETVTLLKGDIDWIVMKCLEKDRTRRYETANGLAADLKRHLNNEPVVARPPSAVYRFQKAFRRNTLAFAAAGAVALTLIAGLGISTWAFLSEAAQRRTAVEEQAKAVRAQKAETKERLRADAERITAQQHLYSADMNLVQLAWEQNNFERTRQSLKETALSPERGFEWYYWQWQTHPELKVLRGHRGGVLAVAISPNGQRVVTGGWDRTAKVWGPQSRPTQDESVHSEPRRSGQVSRPNPRRHGCQVR